MGWSKDKMMDDIEKVAQVQAIAVEAREMEQCEVHETYVDLMGGSDETAIAVAERFPELSRREVADLVEQAFDEAGMECGACHNNLYSD